MTSVAPEALVEEWLGSDRAAIDAAVFSDPFYIPYDQLSLIDGWVVWLGHPPVPDGLNLLPIPERFLWDDPVTAVATSLLVGADYAVRRGAIDSTSATVILERECPLAIIVPGNLHRSVKTLLNSVGRAGIPVVRREIETPDELRAHVGSFRTRSALHAVDLGRRHDPALSFQERGLQASIGGNSLSAFFVHHHGEADRVSVIGDVSHVVGIEIGLSHDSMPFETSSELELEVSRIPSFLDGVSSWVQSDSLAVGWDIASPLPPEILGQSFRVYLKRLFGVPLVDVRIVFDPPSTGSAELTEMRARAARFRHDQESELPSPHEHETACEQSSVIAGQS